MTKHILKNGKTRDSFYPLSKKTIQPDFPQKSMAGPLLLSQDISFFHTILTLHAYFLIIVCKKYLLLSFYC